jgi:hypothetical protein
MDDKDESSCIYKKACYVGAVVVLILVLLWLFDYYTITKPENLTNDQVTAALIKSVLASNPQNSAALFKAMTPAERKKFEYLTPLPYDPNYYRL